MFFNNKCNTFFRFKLDISLYIPHVHGMAFSLSNTQLRRLFVQRATSYWLLFVQLEELPVAQEKILSLLQKVENLEAIICIRGDNEK